MAYILGCVAGYVLIGFVVWVIFSYENFYAINQ